MESTLKLPSSIIFVFLVCFMLWVSVGVLLVKERLIRNIWSVSCTVNVIFNVVGVIIPYVVVLIDMLFDYCSRLTCIHALLFDSTKVMAIHLEVFFWSVKTKSTHHYSKCLTKKIFTTCNLENGCGIFIEMYFSSYFKFVYK